MLETVSEDFTASGAGTGQSAAHRVPARSRRRASCRPPTYTHSLISLTVRADNSTLVSTCTRARSRVFTCVDTRAYVCTCLRVYYVYVQMSVLTCHIEGRLAR